MSNYVLHLTVPDYVPAKAGPVTLAWPEGPVVEVGVLGAAFIGPDEFAREQEAFLDLLEACKVAQRVADADAKLLPGSAHYRLIAAAIAKATGEDS